MLTELIPKVQIQTIGLHNIQADSEIQSRASMSIEYMKEFSEALANGAVFPPIDVFWDGKTYWLADGFHRYQAHKNVLLKNIRCIVHDGTRDDAIIFSAGANKKFSIRRTDADIRKAITMLLERPEWFKVSGSQIASHVGCAPMTVSKVREQWCQSKGVELPKTFTATNGRDQPSIKTSRFTKRSVASNFTVNPPRENLPDRYDLEWTYIFNLFKNRFGFKSVIEQGKAMIYPGVKVLYRSDLLMLMTPCKFSFVDELPMAVGRIMLARQMVHHNRSIILCYDDQGTAKTMELATQIGIEFLSPEELISQLK